MSAGFDGPCSRDGGCAGIGPGHGEGDDNEQGVEFGGLCEAGFFHVQATGFAVAEQAFDLPTFPVSLEGLVGGAIGGEDQKLAVAQPFGGKGKRRSQAGQGDEGCGTESPLSRAGGDL